MGLAGKKTVIHQISCGEDHSAFIASGGYIYTMGSNSDGKLGISSKSMAFSSSPCLVESLSKQRAVRISCGWGHTSAVMEKGELYSWGHGADGQLGIGSLTNHYTPQKVTFYNNTNGETLKIHAIDVDCGTRHTGVLSDKGEMFMFGAGDYGQLGTGRMEQEVIPLRIDFYTRIHKISCGHNHTVILTEGGRIYASGNNLSGQLGTKTRKSSSLFVKTLVPENLKFKKIAAGSHSAAISFEGDLYLWGTGTFGEYLAPQRIVGFKHPFKRISVGNGFGCCVDSKGNIHSWGHNNHGELGTGYYESRLSPKQILTLQGKRVTSVSCGGNFAFALGDTLSFSHESPGSQQRLNKNLDLISQQDQSLDLIDDKPPERDPLEKISNHSSLRASVKNRGSNYVSCEDSTKEMLSLDKSKQLEEAKIFQGKRNSFDSGGLFKDGILSLELQSRPLMKELQNRQSGQDSQGSSMFIIRKEIEPGYEYNRNETEQRAAGIRNSSLNNTPTNATADQQRPESSERALNDIGNKQNLKTKKETPGAKVDSPAYLHSTKASRGRNTSTPRLEDKENKPSSSLEKKKERLSQDKSPTKPKKLRPGSKQPSADKSNTPTKQKAGEKTLINSKNFRTTLHTKSPNKVTKAQETINEPQNEKNNQTVEVLREEIWSLKGIISELHEELARVEKGEYNVHEKILAAKVKNLEDNSRIYEKEIDDQKERNKILEVALQTERNKNTLLQKDLEANRTKFLAIENEMKRTSDKKNQNKLSELEKEKSYYKKTLDELSARVEKQVLEYGEIFRKKEAELAQMQYDKRLLESKIDDMTNMIRELTNLQDEDKRTLDELITKLEDNEAQLKRLIIEKEEALTSLEVAEGTLQETKMNFEERVSALNKLLTNRSGGAHRSEDDFLRLKQENRELVKEISKLQEQLHEKWENTKVLRNTADNQLADEAKLSSTSRYRYEDKNYHRESSSRPELKGSAYLDQRREIHYDDEEEEYIAPSSILKRDTSSKERSAKKQTKSVNFETGTREVLGDFSPNEQSSHSIHLLNDTLEKRLLPSRSYDREALSERNSEHINFAEFQHIMPLTGYQNAYFDEFCRARNANVLDPRSNDSPPPSRVSVQQRAAINMSGRNTNLENYELKDRNSQTQAPHAGRSNQSRVLVEPGDRLPLKSKNVPENSSSVRSSYEKAHSRLQGVEILLSEDRLKNSARMKPGKPNAQYQQLEEDYNSPTKENINIAQKSSRSTNRSVADKSHLNDLTSKLQNLQENKTKLEKRMKEFEKKLKHNDK